MESARRGARIAVFGALSVAAGCQLVGGIEAFTAATPTTAEGGAASEGGVASDGGPCLSADACASPIVAQGLAEPRDVAVCNGRVYWTEWAGGGTGGSFRDCRVGQTCAASDIETFATDLAGPLLVAGGCAQLMYVESIGRRIHQMTRDDAGVYTETLLADETDQPDASIGAAAFGFDLLAWSELPSQLRRCTPPSCQSSRGGFVGGRSALGPMRVTLEVKDKGGGGDPQKGLLVWAEGNNGGQLSKCRPGCFSVSSASPSNQGEIVDLTISADGATYYYLTAKGGLFSVPAVTPSTATTIATGLDPPTRFALDEASGEFYVTSATAGTIVRVALGSQDRPVLFSGLEAPWGIAFDQGAIYWAAGGAGTVSSARVH